MSASLAALQAAIEENPGLNGADYLILDGEGITARSAAPGCSQMAADCQIEQSKVPNLVPVLEDYPDRPDVFGLQGWLLANQFAFVP